MRWCLIMMLILVTNSIFAQVELIKNGSFEELLACPAGGTGSSSIEFATGWKNAVWYYSTPDLFNECGNEIDQGRLGVPYNAAGYQMPKTGVGYSGIYVYSSDNLREIIQSKLISTLIPGKKYLVSFYASFSTYYSYKADKFCIALTSNMIEAKNEQDILAGNYFPNLSDTDMIIFNDLLSADTAGWTYFSIEFKASSPAQYITIGNILPNSQTVTEYSWPPFPGISGRASYIFLDDISLICLDTANCDGSVGMEPVKERRFSVYPNPAKDMLTIEFPENSGEIVLEIFSITGQRVMHTNFFASFETLQVGHLPTGLFLMKLTNKYGVSSTKRIIIER